MDTSNANENSFLSDSLDSTSADTPLMPTSKVEEFLSYVKGSPKPVKKAREFTDDLHSLFWSLRRYRNTTKLNLGEKRKVTRLIDQLKSALDITGKN